MVILVFRPGHCASSAKLSKQRAQSEVRTCVGAAAGVSQQQI